EAAGFRGSLEMRAPIEGIDFVLYMVIVERKCRRIILRTDDRVAALNVAPQVRKVLLRLQAWDHVLLSQGRPGFAFKQLEVQRQHGDLNRLAVDIQTKDVVEKNLMLCVSCQPQLTLQLIAMLPFLLARIVPIPGKQMFTDPF